MSESVTQAEAAGTLMERDLSLLSAHLLLHILEIDRQHARQAAPGAGAQPLRNETSGRKSPE